MVFTARSYEALSSWHWNPDLCSLAWGWGHLLPNHVPWFLSTTGECGTACSATSLPWLPISAHLTHLGVCGLFKSLVVRLSYSLIFWQFWAFFCFEVSCDSSCGCMRSLSVSTYTSILTVSCLFLNYPDLIYELKTYPLCIYCLFSLATWQA